MRGVAVVGSGFMGRTWSEVVTSGCPDARLVGVTGGDRAVALAEDYGCRLYRTVDDLLADPEVEVVVVASPPGAHLAQTTAAARAGKHVLVEKPMAQNPGECRRMADVCSGADVRLGVVSQHRFREIPAAAKRLVDDAAIGQVTMVRVLGPEVGFWDTSKTRDGWKLDPAQQTAYASWGAHACDLLRWFVGFDADLVFALFGQYTNDPPPMRSAMVTYRFAGGAMAQVWMSYDIPPPGLGGGLQYLIVGTEGMIEFDSYGALRVGRGDSWTTLHEQPPFDLTNPRDPVRLGAYAAQLNDLFSAIDDARAPAVHGLDGLAITRMLHGAEQSARSGRCVYLREQENSSCSEQPIHAYEDEIRS